jgi:tyrosyl-tRNA synthetase
MRASCELRRNKENDFHSLTMNTMDTDNGTDMFKHCQEVINKDNLQAIAKERPLKGYWGTAPTGRPHIAYLFPILSISRMVKAGCKMTILIADYHAALDNNKTEWEALHSRTQYYTVVIKELLRLTGVNPDDVVFVKGTDHQRGNPAYLDDLLRLSTAITVNIAKKATAEVVKCSSNPPLSNCIYPLMQVLDEEYLGTDFEFGGVDQRKIFMFGIDYLPRIGYDRSRSYIMNPMIHSLGKEGKMSASDAKSKIDLLDTPEDIMDKCKKAFSKDGVVEENGVLEMYKYLIFELHEGAVIIERPEKYGGNVSFITYDELCQAFLANTVSSIDLKTTLGQLLSDILAPLRTNIAANYPDLVENAYKLKA